MEKIKTTLTQENIDEIKKLMREVMDENFKSESTRVSLFGELKEIFNVIKERYLLTNPNDNGKV